MRRHLRLFPGFFALLAGAVCAIQPQDAPRPSVTFDLFWDAATPQSYRITVDTTGSARYESHTPPRPGEGRSATPSEQDDFEMTFVISKATRDQIFQMAQELDYFNGDWDFSKHAMANTGKKTLTYADSSRKFQTTYNYSESKAVQRITAIFQGISLTLEHGRRLQFLHRFDRLGLDAELRAMEDMAKNNDLVELQLIGPTLRKIADDTRIMNMARQRCLRLLKHAESQFPEAR